MKKTNNLRIKKTSRTSKGQNIRFNCEYPGRKNKCCILFTLEDESVSLWFNDQTQFHKEVDLKEKE